MICSSLCRVPFMGWRNSLSKAVQFSGARSSLSIYAPSQHSIREIFAARTQVKTGARFLAWGQIKIHSPYPSLFATT
jgi:hypothetical protein